MTLAVLRVPACTSHAEPSPPAKRRLPLNARLVLEALVEAGQPCKAYSLLEQLREKGVSSPMTVYRALDRLSELGLIRRIESLNAFIALPPEIKGPIAFRICRQCGRTEIVELDQAALDVLAAAGINAEDSYIEAYCDCSAC